MFPSTNLTLVAATALGPVATIGVLVVAFADHRIVVRLLRKAVVVCESVVLVVLRVRATSADRGSRVGWDDSRVRSAIEENKPLCQ